MKNCFLLILFAGMMHATVKAQELTYGVLLGVNASDINISESGLNAGAAYSAFNQSGFPLDIGVYVDYGFDASFGIKTKLYYGESYQEYYLDSNIATRFNFVVGQITLQPLLKYDVNKAYGKGFYLLAGPRASFVTSTKLTEGDEEDAEGFFKKSNFGAGIGFGFTFSQTIGFELMGDYGFSNLLDSPDFKTSTAGASASLYFNLEQLLNK